RPDPDRRDRRTPRRRRVHVPHPRPTIRRTRAVLTPRVARRRVLARRDGPHASPQRDRRPVRQAPTGRDRVLGGAVTWTFHSATVSEARASAVVVEVPGHHDITDRHRWRVVDRHSEGRVLESRKVGRADGYVHNLTIVLLENGPVRNTLWLKHEPVVVQFA